MNGPDPYAGMFEFPGGRLEEGETPIQAAIREWQEETGMKLPEGDLTGHWISEDGSYEGYVLTIPSEEDLDILGDRDEVPNPDDPDGDITEAIVWFDPEQLKDNPAVRPQLVADLDSVFSALVTR